MLLLGDPNQRGVAFPLWREGLCAPGTGRLVWKAEKNRAASNIGRRTPPAQKFGGCRTSFVEIKDSLVFITFLLIFSLLQPPRSAEREVAPREHRPASGVLSAMRESLDGWYDSEIMPVILDRGDRILILTQGPLHTSPATNP